MATFSAVASAWTSTTIVAARLSCLVDEGVDDAEG